MEKGAALIEEEAKLGCVENKYSSFIHILALCSVLKRVCYIYYPDCGTKKLKSLFNQKITPRTDIESNYSVHILCCREGGTSKEIFGFTHNHYVPIAFKDKRAKKRTIKLPVEKVSSKKVKVDLGKAVSISQTNLSFWGAMKNKSINGRVFIPIVKKRKLKILLKQKNLI